jgi:hypothetical protein
MTGYLRYVNGILIIYYQKKTNVDETGAKSKNKKSNIKFTIEKEHHNSINFLNLTMQCKRTKLEFMVCRKPTQRDVIILNGSCLPHEHKIASTNYLMNRVHKYPITKEAREKELSIIQDILHNNEYNTDLSMRQPDPYKHNKNTDLQHQKRKWALFTYSEKETKKIMNLNYWVMHPVACVSVNI